MTLDKIIDNVFEHYGLDEILLSLAKRLREEANIAQGEDRKEDAQHWLHIAQELETIYP